MAKSKNVRHRAKIVKPTVHKGQIVTYCISDHDAEIINQRRVTYMKGDAPSGVLVYSGNAVQEGDTFPMVVTHVAGGDAIDAVSGQVILDGTDTYWAVDTHEGTEPGTYAVD